MEDTCELTILMPCLNESETLAFLVLFVSSYGYCFSAWSSAGYGDMASPFVDNLSILAIVFGAMAVFSFMLAFIIAVCKEFGMRH